MGGACLCRCRRGVQLSILRFGRHTPETPDAIGWRGGHPFISALASMMSFTVPEVATMHRHMRDCVQCRNGWQLISGDEWSVPKGFRGES